MNHFAVASIALLACSTAARGSGSIPITNAGFEDPVVADNSYNDSDTIPGWNQFNGADLGVWNVSTADLTAEAPEGSNVAYVYQATTEAGLSQTLSGGTGQLQADAGYSLTVQVCNTASVADFPGYRVQLLANGTVLAEDDNTLAPAEGGFLQSTVNYTYTAAQAALVGQPLEIRLLSKALVSSEVEFDAVQLAVTLGNPAANPGGPYSVSLGGSLSLDGSGSLPSDGQTITTWEWDLDNDGTFDVTGVTPAAITYDDLQATYSMIVGANTIKLRVTDDSSPTPKTSTSEGTVAILPPVSMFTPSTVQPTFDGLDIGYFFAGSPSTNAEDKWFYENSGAGQAKGQTFTLTESVLLKAVTYRLADTNKPATEAKPVDYLFRIGVVDTATNTFNPIHQETITQTVNWGEKGVSTDTYGTWSLGSPVTLPALPTGTLYGFDLTMTANTWAWQDGIPYPLYDNGGNPYADGEKYTTPLDGAAGVPTNNISYHGARDREFHIDLEATTIIDPTAPTLVSIGDNVAGGPIYADQVQIMYTLTFDESIDAATIDLADFENLGSGVSIDSVVSAAQTTPFPLPSVIKVVLGVSGTGTLQLGVKSGASIADIAGNPVTSPVADDTTITVNAGTAPGTTGDRWWDGTTTTGITDGVSQGGTATWDTTTTNWDRGFGFAAPIAWSNSGGEIAVFGGTAGTVALDGNKTLDGLTFKVVDAAGSGYFIGDAAEDNTLTFGGSKTITLNATGTNTNQDATIRAGIAGSPTLNIHGRANNSQFFALEPTADVTMTLGTLNMFNTYASNKQLRLGGPGSGNVVDQVTWTVTGNQLQVRKQDSTNGGAGGSDWTINQNISLDDGRIYVDEGTLILGGTDNFMSHSIEVLAGGRIVLQGNWRIHDENEDFRVLSGGIVAPGGGVGTATFNWNSSRNDPSVGLVDLRTGSTYEWEVGASATDTIALTEPVANGNAELVVATGTTLKVVSAGGSPGPTDKLTVFTYDAGVVTPNTAALNANMTIDLTGTSWTGTPSFVNDGAGTIYVTGIDGGGGGNTYAAWIAGYPGVGALTGFTDDPDFDGNDNGLENLFGTDPSAFTAGLVAGTKSGNTFTFTHPQNATPASGVTAAYSWSTDLATFTADNVANGGTTVNFSSVVNAGVATVTATITGTSIDKLFVRVSATQN